MLDLRIIVVSLQPFVKDTTALDATELRMIFIKESCYFQNIHCIIIH